MTRKDILSILLRVIGIYYLLQVLIAIPNYIDMMSYSNAAQGIDQFWMITYSLLSISLYLAIGYVLITDADKIAGKLIPTGNEMSFNYSPEIKKDILELTLKIIGIICLITGLPGFIGYGMDIAYRKYWNYFDGKNWFWWGNFLDAIASTIIGVLLLCFAEKIVKRFSKANRTKINPASD